MAKGIANGFPMGAIVTTAGGFNRQRASAVRRVCKCSISSCWPYLLSPSRNCSLLQQGRPLQHLRRKPRGRSHRFICAGCEREWLPWMGSAILSVFLLRIENKGGVSSGRRSERTVCSRTASPWAPTWWRSWPSSETSTRSSATSVEKAWWLEWKWSKTRCARLRRESNVPLCVPPGGVGVGGQLAISGSSSDHLQPQCEICLILDFQFIL